MPSIQWVTPAANWKNSSVGLQVLDTSKPWLVEFDGDNFMPDFLELMGNAPTSLVNKAPELTDGTLKLYQPLHGRFYLVTGSLICRQLGLPDRNVARQNHERTSYVLRRLISVNSVPQEQAWVDEGPHKGWNNVTASAPVRDDEERFPLHPVTTCVPTLNGKPDACEQRIIHYGYIPAGNRAKYRSKFLTPTTDPAHDLQTFLDAVKRDGPHTEGDFRLGQVDDRVIGPWKALLDGPVESNRVAEISLYLILDLADFLNRTLNDVFKAITDGGTLSGAAKTLYDELGNIHITVNGVNKTLRYAIDQLKADLDLVTGQGTPPSDQYDLSNATFGNLGSRVNAPYLEDTLKVFLGNALDQESKLMQPAPEMTALLSDQVNITPQEGDTFRLYLVYEREGCPPIMSQPSDSFSFARFFDPDAPARHIQIELPSIKLSDLRKYKHGVGLQMSPDLRDVMNRVNKDMLTGSGLSGAPSGWELGMICSFSLQIIFLVAFIVMFIFLILLNIVFWWLPFLKICFPIPKKA